MKKLITLLLIFTMTTLFAEERCNNNGICITGNFTNVSDSEYYTITSDSPVLDIRFSYIQGSHITEWANISGGPNGGVVHIKFSQSDCESRGTTVSFNFRVDFTQNDFMNQSMSIRPRYALGELDPITSGTGGTYANQYYTFSTSADNAVSYNWFVDGGTISGPNNGETIRVIADASACQEDIEVTAIGVNSCGVVTDAEFTRRDVSAPVYVGTISGPDIVGLYYGDYSAYNSSAYVPSGSIHEYVWSVSGPFQLGSNGNRQTHVFVNTYAQTGSGTLYVYVKNLCGQTITKSKNLLVGNVLIGGGGGWGGIAGGDGSGPDAAWVDVVETKVVSNAGELKLIVPNFEEKDLQIYIYNLNGRVIQKLKPKNFEVHLDRSKYKGGIYVAKTISKKEMSTTKFAISQ